MALNHLSDIGFEDFMKLCKDYTKEQYLFSVNNTTFRQIIHYGLGRSYYKIKY